ncbi:hypothetical protein B9Z55_007237 [Caenorhabditis nigoni]|uniref:Domain of unknown function WSN domain-containing protein n=1 Tax=Caenorhabditis nigoni TaxID=1611254 RepID=A0A2G5V9E3_9PELO|nr:hypothetical protein B9Z55_007237 [Caenorhabditis nigoni]
MRTSCFITSLLLLAPAVWTAAKQDKSDLELITEDFQILARITNAAFLQAALVRKDVKARDVIVEFLKITPLDFNQITAIDAQSAIKSITKTYQNAQQFAKMNESDKHQLDDIANSFDSKLEDWDDEPWNPVMKTSLEDLYTESDKIFQTFSRACRESTLKSIDSLSEYINLEDDSRPLGETTASKVKDFKNDFKSIKPCFEKIRDFLKVMSSSSLKTDENSPDIVLRDTKENILRLDYWKTATGLIQESWTNSSDIWGKESVLRSYTSLGQQLSELIQFHKLHSDSLDSPPNSLTIGFLQPDDTQKVQQDLRSMWFEKHFVRKANVETLSKALKPFLEISKTIKSLADKWFPIYRLDDETAENYKEVAEFLKVVDNYVPNQKTYDLQIGLLVGTFSKCFKPPANEFNATRLLYEAQSKPRIKALEGLDKLITAAEKFLETNFINESSIYGLAAENCFNNFEQFLSGNINETNSFPIIKDMRQNYTKCVARRGYNMTHLVFSFSNVYTKMRSYLELSAAVDESDKKRTQTTLVTLEEVVKQSNTVPSLECLRNEKFNATNLEKLMPIARLLATMTSPPSATFVKAIESYLGSIAQVKSALANVEKTIRAVKSRSKRAVSSGETNPVLALNISRLENENMGTCVKALSNLIEVRARRNQLLSVGRFDGDARDLMSKESGLEDFMDSTDELSKLLKQADDLDTKAKSWREKSLEEMSAVFQEMTHMRGILGDRDKLWKLSKSNSTDDPKFDGAKKKWEVLTEINLNFQVYEKEVANGTVVVATLKKRFDHIFGHDQDNENNKLTFDVWLKLISIFFLILYVIAFFTLADLPC